MGTTTDFLGHVEIRPALNEAEQFYLTAFAQSRRCERPGGPYAVPRNPAAERGARYVGVDLEVENNVVSEQTVSSPARQFFDMNPLPYEIDIEQQRSRRPRRKTG